MPSKLSFSRPVSKIGIIPQYHYQSSRIKLSNILSFLDIHRSKQNATKIMVKLSEGWEDDNVKSRTTTDPNFAGELDYLRSEDGRIDFLNTVHEDGQSRLKEIAEYQKIVEGLNYRWKSSSLSQTEEIMLRDFRRDYPELLKKDLMEKKLDNIKWGLAGAKRDLKEFLLDVETALFD